MSKGKGFGTLLHQQGITYVVHCPERDDYLVTASGDLSQWNSHPSKAKPFKTFKQAFNTASGLAETKQRGFWVCKVSDTGKQLQVERVALIQPQALAPPADTISMQDVLKRLNNESHPG